MSQTPPRALACGASRRGDGFASRARLLEHRVLEELAPLPALIERTDGIVVTIFTPFRGEATLVLVGT
jgi:hypothetical protein